MIITDNPCINTKWTFLDQNSTKQKLSIPRTSIYRVFLILLPFIILNWMEMYSPTAPWSLLQLLHKLKHVANIRSSFLVNPSRLVSSSTVKVLDDKTVPLVVRHLIAGFLLLANDKADLADSATLATCSGFSIAREFGVQSRGSAPLANPSSSFRTVNQILRFCFLFRWVDALMDLELSLNKVGQFRKKCFLHKTWKLLVIYINNVKYVNCM